MAVKFVCDACGKEQPGEFNRQGNAFKPAHWFQRSDDDGTQVVCSRECIDKLAAITGKTRVVLPF